MVVKRVMMLQEFRYIDRLIIFVEKNNIKQQDIQQIIMLDDAPHNIKLIYWGSELE